jgi:hypothetical protein
MYMTLGSRFQAGNSIYRRVRYQPTTWITATAVQLSRLTSDASTVTFSGCTVASASWSGLLAAGSTIAWTTSRTITSKVETPRGALDPRRPIRPAMCKSSLIARSEFPEWILGPLTRQFIAPESQDILLFLNFNNKGIRSVDPAFWLSPSFPGYWTCLWKSSSGMGNVDVLEQLCVNRRQH